MGGPLIFGTGGCWCTWLAIWKGVAALLPPLSSYTTSKDFTCDRRLGQESGDADSLVRPSEDDVTVSDFRRCSEVPLQYG